MYKYDELMEKAPIIGIGEKVVHLSDFVNDIRFSTDNRLNKEKALEDLEVVIDFINQYLNIEQELGIDLATLLKAQRYGFYIVNVFGEIEKVKLSEWRFNLVKKEVHRITWNKHLLFADYGKTWALTKGELEDEKRSRLH